MRNFFFKLAFERAHKSMKLGSTFHVPNLQCYASEQYSFEQAREKKCSHAVIGKMEYTYWFQPGDRDTSWSSWSTHNVDDFIRKFHHENIYGERATYPLIITQIIHGHYMDYAMKGKQNIFEEKRKIIRDFIEKLLERHLNSFSHRLICLCLRLVK